MNLGSTTRWYHRVPVVLLMLFFVLGPFGLPLLWRSPDFNRPAKIALTVLLIVLTIALIWKITVDAIAIVEQFQHYADR